MTRSRHIHIRITEAEYTAIEAAARAADMSVSEYLRTAGKSGSRCGRCGGSGVEPQPTERAARSRLADIRARVFDGQTVEWDFRSDLVWLVNELDQRTS